MKINSIDGSLCCRSAPVRWECASETFACRGAMIMSVLWNLAPPHVFERRQTECCSSNVTRVTCSDSGGGAPTTGPTTAPAKTPAPTTSAPLPPKATTSPPSPGPSPTTPSQQPAPPGAPAINGLGTFPLTISWLCHLSPDRASSEQRA